MVIDSALILERSKFALKSGLGAPLLIVGLLAMVILPLPPFVLDILFTFNITFALIILLVVIYSNRPMDFSIFPMVILIATLLRLSLNVASTRVVLLYGHEGTAAAGKVIESFGAVVIGGNFAVGMVVFVILIIINFMVITKGAGRIAEVSARFTLDSLPGKQMAIDADLNAGFIDQNEAKQRREGLASEADFYGSMDGASKFVRGDAVAGILITVINMVGGFLIGIIQHDMSAAESAEVFVLLTIGDGLVAQIPSLIMSSAAGLLVTRENKDKGVDEQFKAQMFSKDRVLIISAVVMGMVGIVPGMPHVSFLSFAILLAGIVWWKNNNKKHDLISIEEEQQQALTASDDSHIQKELSWDDVMPVDAIGLEVGYRLIPMVDRNQGGELMTRIKGIRKKLSQDLGFLIPPVHIRDNLDLPPNAYRITLMGVSVAESLIHPDRDMAINPGQVFGEIQGTPGKDPAFGLDAIWIDMADKMQAQTLGYTVVDANTVVATHLSKILQENAHELLGHEETQHLLDRLSATSAKLVEDLVPKQIPLSSVVKILQNLLSEGVPISDFRGIAECLAEHVSRTQDANILTSLVRVALGRMIVQKINGLNNELPVITLEPSLEQLLMQSTQMTEDSGGIEPGLAERLHSSLLQSSQNQESLGQPSVLLVSAAVRKMLSVFTKHSIPQLNVLAYNEVPNTMQIKIVASVGQ